MKAPASSITIRARQSASREPATADGLPSPDDRAKPNDIRTTARRRHFALVPGLYRNGHSIPGYALVGPERSPRDSTRIDIGPSTTGPAPRPDPLSTPGVADRGRTLSRRHRNRWRDGRRPWQPPYGPSHHNMAWRCGFKSLSGLRSWRGTALSVPSGAG
jgi:hypothetical protein